MVEVLEPRCLMSGSSTDARVTPQPLNDGLAGVRLDQTFGTLRADSADAFGEKPITAIVRWGDRSGKILLATHYDPGIGGFAAVASHDFAEPGDYKVTVVFKQKGKVLGRLRDVVEISGTTSGGRTLTTPLHVPLEGSLGTIENGLNPLTNAVVEWGDGVRTGAMLVELDNGRYEVIASHTFDSPATRFVRVYAVYDGPPATEGVPGMGVPPQTLLVLQSKIIAVVS
jgi:hypothetical protein